MGARFTIRPPADYLLRRDACSYGYFLLAPNVWDPQRGTMTRTLDPGEGPATLTIAQDQSPGATLRIAADRAMTARERADAKRQVARMLRLDDDSVRRFHSLDRRWRRSGRGRLFRSPTLFEDVLKTVTSCNVTWPSTVFMNRRLCEVVNPAFPSPSQLARRRPQTLRARCRVGYRDKRMIELARLFASGDVDVERLEDAATSDDDVMSALLSLPGVGPYAAANVLQLLGRYSRLPVDSETIRHAKTALGFSGSESTIRKRVEAHYARFGDQRFRSYWFELLRFYESKKGPSWTWSPREVGASFTAANF